MNHSLTACIVMALLGCSYEHESTEAAADTARATRASGPLRELPLLTYEQRQGKHVYAKYCTVCHGVEGKGDGFNAFNLDPKPRDFTDSRTMNAMTDARLLETITEGGRGVNRSVLMPSWGGRLTNIERTYVAAYIRHLGDRDD